MKLIKKILFLLSFFLLYLIVKEFLSLYYYLSSINELLAIGVMIILGGFIIYFGIIPVIQIVMLPANFGPTKDGSKVDALIERRIKKFRGNQYLKEINFDFNSLENNYTSYEKVIQHLEPKCVEIRKRYVNQVFYSTSISQNGFLDAILIFSSAVNMIKEIFLLYHGRVSNRDLLIIAKKVYYSVLIGGSEGIEYATEELFSKLATDTVKSVPFLDKIFSSLADGFVNAVLLTRISLITENYCKILYVEKDREIYPKPSFVFSTASNLTADIFSKVKSNLLILAKEKSENVLKKAINPVTVVLEKSYTGFMESKPLTKTGSLLINSFKWLKTLGSPKSTFND